MDPERKVRILLVDDEPALTKLMQTYLGKLGYNVDSALNATDALALFSRDGKDYDLLVADVTLPDVSGDKMALEMLKQDPTLRVLLCSGYPFEVDSLSPEVQSRFASLQKPFLPNMLAKAIEDLLERKID